MVPTRNCTKKTVFGLLCGRGSRIIFLYANVATNYKRTILSRKVKYHYPYFTCRLPPLFHPSDRLMKPVTQQFFSVLSLAPKKTHTLNLRICDKVISSYDIIMYGSFIFSRGLCVLIIKTVLITADNWVPSCTCTEYNNCS